MSTKKTSFKKNFLAFVAAAVSTVFIFSSALAATFSGEERKTPKVKSGTSITVVDKSKTPHQLLMDRLGYGVEDNKSKKSFAFEFGATNSAMDVRVDRDLKTVSINYDDGSTDVLAEQVENLYEREAGDNRGTNTSLSNASAAQQAKVGILRTLYNKISAPLAKDGKEEVTCTKAAADKRLKCSVTRNGPRI